VYPLQRNTGEEVESTIVNEAHDSQPPLGTALDGLPQVLRQGAGANDDHVAGVVPGAAQRLERGVQEESECGLQPEERHREDERKGRRDRSLEGEDHGGHHQDSEPVRAREPAQARACFHAALRAIPATASDEEWPDEADQQPETQHGEQARSSTRSQMPHFRLEE
jgi:hypothetical protein